VRCHRQSKHLKGQIAPKQPTENRLHTSRSRRRWSSPSMIICKPVIGNTSCCPDDTPIRAIRRAARTRRVRQTGGFVLTAYSEETFSPSRQRSGNGPNNTLVVEVQPLTPRSPLRGSLCWYSTRRGRPRVTLQRLRTAQLLNGRPPENNPSAHLDGLSPNHRKASDATDSTLSIRLQQLGRDGVGSGLSTRWGRSPRQANLRLRKCRNSRAGL
jgi:hypothetical protein